MSTRQRRATIAVLVILAAGLGLSSALSAEARRAPLDVTYVANEGFLIEAAGKKVLVDSLFDTGFDTFLAPSQEVLDQTTGARGPFADVDLLLVTHPHGDHFNPKLVAAHLRNNARCRLIAHTQTVDQLRKEEGFAQIQDRIHEVGLDPGAREHVTVNGIAVDVLCLSHMPYYEGGRNVHERHEESRRSSSTWAGTRLLHLGDAMIEHSAACLSAYPFEDQPVDLLFLEYFDRSQATQQFIARKIKPSRIIAMHVPPAELEEEVEEDPCGLPPCDRLQAEHGAAFASDRGRLPQPFGGLLRADAAWRDAAGLRAWDRVDRRPTNTARHPSLPTATRCSGGRTGGLDPTTRSGSP